MAETSNFVEAVQNVILEPNLFGAMWMFVLTFIGELVAPFPSSLFLAGQLLFLDGNLSTGLVFKLLLFVAIPMAAGTTLGSFFSYGIAYIGGKPAIDKFSKYLRFSWEDVEKFESRFKNKWYDEVLFLLLRIVPLTPTIPVNLAAGVLRMRFFNYTVLTFVGMTIRMMIMLFVFGAGVGGGEVLIRLLDL